MILYLENMQYRDELIYGLCLLEDLTRAGVKCIPSLKGFYNSDKFSNYLLWYKYLRIKEIQMPDTLCSINLKMCINFLKKYGKVIFKPISGSQGTGIEILETAERLKELLEEYHAICLQKIVEDRGYDIRTLMIGDQFVCQYARYNPKKLLKNIHFGAIPKSIEGMSEIDPEVTQFARSSLEISKKIQKIAELDIIGVDTLPSKDGNIYFLEWNSMPGFRGAEEVTGANIAGEIVKFLLKD